MCVLPSLTVFLMGLTPPPTNYYQGPLLMHYHKGPLPTRCVATWGLRLLIATRGLRPLIATRGLNPLITASGFCPLLIVKGLRSLLNTRGLYRLITTGGGGGGGVGGGAFLIHPTCMEPSSHLLTNRSLFPFLLTWGPLRPSLPTTKVFHPSLLQGPLITTRGGRGNPPSLLITRGASGPLKLPGGMGHPTLIIYTPPLFTR